MKQTNFIDSYCMSWLLENPDTGLKFIEEYENISLSDFEVIYGNNTYKILEIKLLHTPLTTTGEQSTLDL